MIVRRLSRLGGLLLLMAVVSTSFAQDTPKLLTALIVAGKDGIELPQDLTAGLVSIAFQNDTEAPFSPILARLNDGKALEDFMQAMQQPSPSAVLEVVSLIGSLETPPESSSIVTYDLLAGEYVLLSFTAGGPPEVNPFTVSEAVGEPLEAPKADQVITFADFVFGIPTELKAGEQTWEIVNSGEQFHEMRMMRVDEGTTVKEVTDALMEAMMSAQGGPPQMPYENVLAWSPISPDLTAWITVDLEPGTYAVICGLPDVMAEEGAAFTSHLQHGMITIVTVTD